MHAVIIFDSQIVNYPLFEEVVSEIQMALDARGVETHVVNLNGQALDNHLDLLRDLKEEAGILAFYGHGCLCGCSLMFKTESVVGVIDMEVLSNKSVLYTIACHAAKSLGRKFIEVYKDRGFFGYDDVFMLGINDVKHRDFQVALLRSAQIGLHRMISENVSCQEAARSVRIGYRHLLHDVWRGKICNNIKIRRTLRPGYGFTIEWNLLHFKSHISKDLQIF
ncbi:hypothetical protein EHM69_00915 [candidate division KSB1 bacterium]|nr:MAG: hypothetical protein EHM69_00915 [candidate division KSB1 bacterium]